MHPILASGQRLVLYLGSWLLIAVLLGVAYATAGDVGILLSLAVVVPLCIVYSFACLSAWYVCGATPLRTTPLSRILMNHVGSSILTSALWLVAWEIWTQILDGYPPFAGSVDIYRSQLPLIFAAGMLLYWLASMFHYLLVAFERSREADRRELGLEVMAREAELKALRAQIDPHFLFNSLNSISALTGTDARGARQMCLGLADFFRSSVRLGAEDWISLDEEIQMVRQYLDIEKVRCGDRLTTKIEIETECGSCRMPPLILQPLVENAVRHGIQSLVEGGTITITAGCEAGILSLCVENSFDPDSPRKSGAGVGLDNVERRLQTLFGNEAETEVLKTDGRFQVDIRFPCSVE